MKPCPIISAHLKMAELLGKAQIRSPLPLLHLINSRPSLPQRLIPMLLFHHPLLGTGTELSGLGRQGPGAGLDGPKLLVRRTSSSHI